MEGMSVSREDFQTRLQGGDHCAGSRGGGGEAGRGGQSVDGMATQGPGAQQMPAHRGKAARARRQGAGEAPGALQATA